MAFTVEERDTSRTITSGANPAVELRFVVRGVGTDPAKEDDEEALEALQAAAPADFLNLPRRDVRLEPVRIDEGAEGVWDGEATYAPAQQENEPPQQGESVFSFDTGGGTQHITHSQATVATFAPLGATAPDFQGAIGVTADSVEGVDIVVPVYQFTETHVFADAAVTDIFKTTLMFMTGRVNSDAFRGFAAGSVLFLGAAGSRRGDGDWEITFRFAVSPNLSAINVGPITNIAKKGWEYLWVRYEDTEDAGAQSIVKRPVAAYVERVYLELPFSVLGI
jgi:hypothetical protein